MYLVEANFCYLFACILKILLSQVYSCRPVGGQVQCYVSHSLWFLSILFSLTYFRYSFNACSCVRYAYMIMFVRLWVTFTRWLYHYVEGRLVVYSMSECL